MSRNSAELCGAGLHPAPQAHAVSPSTSEMPSDLRRSETLHEPRGQAKCRSNPNRIKYLARKYTIAQWRQSEVYAARALRRDRLMLFSTPVRKIRSRWYSGNTRTHYHL